MATSPPSYSPGDAPPTYDEVVQKLNALIGDNPTAEKALEAGDQLTTEELDLLASEHDSRYPLKTDKEKNDFAVGLCHASCTAEAEAHLQAASAEAVAAAAEVEQIFSTLDRKIAEIDLLHESDFRPTLTGIQQEFRSILQKSRDLANTASVSAEDFDDTRMMFWSDDEISIEERIEDVEDHFKKINDYKNEVAGVGDRFQELITRFTDFVGSFSSWAKDKEGELTEKIKELKKEIEKLQKKMEDLDTAANALGATAGLILGAAGLLTAAFPGFVAPIMIAGLLLAGVTIATVIGLLVKARHLGADIRRKESEIEELQKEIEKIRVARADLEAFGQSSLPAFIRCMTILSSFEGATTEDATQVKAWLNKGAPNSDRPAYLSLNQTSEVRSYQAMGKYLDRYAKGVAKYLETAPAIAS